MYTRCELYLAAFTLQGWLDRVDEAWKGAKDRAARA